MKSVLLALVFVYGFIACTPANQRNENDLATTPIPLKYAKGFTLEKADHFYVLKVIAPFKGAKESISYILYDKTSTRPALKADVYIPIPINNIVVTSTTHIPLLDYLNESQALSGFPTLDYISSAKIRARIERGEVTDLGIDEALNIEKLIGLEPNLVMGYSLTGDFGQFNLIKEAGIPVILNAEYLEQHPLGRAEWIKQMGVLFGKLPMADSVFDAIEEEYQATLDIVSTSTRRPTVLSGIVYGDSWYVPGGKNYAATILKDAGFDYFFKQDTSSAFLPLSFETVFNEANKADYWIGVGSFKTLSELAAADQRYTIFAPYKNKSVYSYNKRTGEKGGSEFLELGYLRPDLILKDLVKIGHPNLLPSHELFFYFQLP